MAFSRWIVNASPFILLGKTGQIGLLSALAVRIAVPQAVAEEVGAGNDGRTTLQAIVNDSVFILVENEAPNPEIISWDLGAG
jgi:predicted nucleic acid-binding protein